MGEQERMAKELHKLSLNIEEVKSTSIEKERLAKAALKEQDERSKVLDEKQKAIEENHLAFLEERKAFEAQYLRDKIEAESVEKMRRKLDKMKEDMKAQAEKEKQYRLETESKLRQEIERQELKA